MEELPAMWDDEGFVRSPTARRKLLRRGEELKGILHSTLVLVVAEPEISLPSRRECNHVRVSMLTWKWILSVRQRIKQVMIEQVTKGQPAEVGVAGQLVCKEEILRHNVGFVIRRVLFADAIVNLRRQQGFGTVQDAVEDLNRG